MSSTAVKSSAFGALLVLAGSLLSPAAQAQTVFRIVGPDGKVTYSDKPPPSATETRVTPANAGPATAGASAGLPYALLQVVAKYPVTVYTGDKCGPCMAGVSLLTSRGVPFTEKTVTTNEDAEALRRLSGDNSLPFMTIGGQQLKGFSDAEWTQFLNAAGYPASSTLPPSYRRPAPAPLVGVAQAPARSAETAPAAQPTPRPATPVAPPVTNPAGIRF
jgi:glutaredoxin